MSIIWTPLMTIKWLQRNTVVTPHLTLCITEAEYLKVVKYLKVKHPDSWLRPSFAACMHTFEQNNKITCVVCIDGDRCKSQVLENVMAMLVHEAVHVWQELCLSIGEHNPSKEFEAYSLQCITRELFEAFLEKGEWKGKQKPLKSMKAPRGFKV